MPARVDPRREARVLNVALADDEGLGLHEGGNQAPSCAERSLKNLSLSVISTTDTLKIDGFDLRHSIMPYFR
jgi:hypothetical protein